MDIETKKCSFCAEEVLKDAVICKHCKSSLSDSKTTDEKVKETQQTDWKKIGKVVLWIVGISIGLSFWYVAVPALGAWYLFKKRKNKFSQKINIILISLLSVVCIGVWLLSLYADRQPILTIIEPQNETSLQAATISVQGIVEPSSSEVTINNLSVPVDGSGNFTYDVSLPKENNNLNIVAKNGGKTVSETLSVQRIFTPEELVEREQLRVEEETKKQARLEAKQKAQAEADAKAKAELAEYERSKAGQYCKKNPTWTKEECQLVADNRYWVGMTYDMLITLRGKPTSANPSNYGNGTRWQWCWTNRTPSCFYDKNGDNIIDSYN